MHVQPVYIPLEQDVPSPNAKWFEVVPFATTFDGDEYWGSRRVCDEIDARCHHEYDSTGIVRAPMTDLRTSLFVQQRKWRKAHEDTNEAPHDESDKAYIRAVLTAIHNRLRTATNLSNQAVITCLHTRLRQASATHSVTGSLPVLFFGDLFTASIATIGLNPSDLAMVDKHGTELSGKKRQFETLSSFDITDRSKLTEDQCAHACALMRAYFEPGKPKSSWFNPLDKLTRGMGFSYDAGQVVHLDLVQEATRPTWSTLEAGERAQLRDTDAPFLRWQLEQFPLRLLVCNGRTVYDNVLNLLSARELDSGKRDGRKWYVGQASVKDRLIAIIGWNIPLAQAPGMIEAELKDMGQYLRAQASNYKLQW